MQSMWDSNPSELQAYSWAVSTTDGVNMETETQVDFRPTRWLSCRFHSLAALLVTSAISMSSAKKGECEIALGGVGRNLFCRERECP